MRLGCVILLAIFVAMDHAAGTGFVIGVLNDAEVWLRGL